VRADIFKYEKIGSGEAEVAKSRRNDFPDDVPVPPHTKGTFSRVSRFVIARGLVEPSADLQSAATSQLKSSAVQVLGCTGWGVRAASRELMGSSTH
jgi:hypothetical protein